MTSVKGLTINEIETLIRSESIKTYRGLPKIGTAASTARKEIFMSINYDILNEKTIR